MSQLNQPNGFANEAPDASIERRPGHPMERSPEPIANAHWLVPDRQQSRVKISMDPSRTEPTATFGSEHPPSGVSGVLRRIAYTQPDYRARRWMLLIAADRVDAVESTLGRALKHPATWMLAAAAGGAWLMLDRKPSRSLLGRA